MEKQQLTQEPNLAKAIENLRQSALQKEHFIRSIYAQYLELNQATTSALLNENLNKVAENWGAMAEAPVYEPSVAQVNNRTQEVILNAINRPPQELLTYKGVNLGSAINLKLAIKLAQQFSAKKS